jgi:hypothetical protein
MAFNINQFRSQMTGDGARPNLFEVVLKFPTLVTGNAEVPFRFMCKTAVIPASSIGSVEVQYFGRTLKFAGNRPTFPDLQLNIINDEDFAVRTAFQQWLNLINSHAGNLQTFANNKNDSGYLQDAIVTQFGKNGNELKKYKFVDCFPTELGEIALDWGSNDQIEEYTVTLAYQWWEAFDYSTDKTQSAQAAGE